MSTAITFNIKQIDHVVLRVMNLEKMISWYETVLGCELERGPGDFRLAQLRAGSSLIDLVDTNSEFGRRAGLEPDHNAPTMDHVCLQVQPWDTHEIQAHLRSHGVEFGEVSERYGAAGIGPSLYLKDPEGNSIELKGV